MRILDENDNELNEEDIDYSTGIMMEDVIVIKHHKAVEEVKEEGHYEVVREYPNGGKDLAWIIDVEAVAPQEAWDETERVKRFHTYTEEELEAMRLAEEEEAQNGIQAQIAELQAAVLELAEAISSEGGE